MNDRRPPPSPSADAQRPLHGQRRDVSSIDSTVLLPRPELSDRSVDDEGPVFDGREDSGPTHTMKAPPRTTASSTADVSVIEAREHPSGPVGDGIAFEDDDVSTGGFDEGYAPATEVLRLAFSDPGGDSVTPVEPEPVAVMKWRAGGGQPPVRALPPEAGPHDERAPEARPPDGAGTRVDVDGDLAGAGAGGRPVDVEALRRTLLEAEQLLRTVQSQASGLDLDLVAPAVRGMNAQLAAAHHRLSEALAMLGK